MKTIDTKSILLGILATALVFTLISGKTIENNDTIEFVASPFGVGIYNKQTKTVYFYKGNSMSAGMKESPDNSYKVADDGATVTKLK